MKVHKMIIQKLSSNQNIMVELPPIINNYELFKSYDSINKIVREGGLQNIAISKQDSIEVDKITNFIDKHRVDDFNNWFTQFMEKNGRGLRDVTTITMDDVKFLNNYFNDLNTSKGLKFGLKKSLSQSSYFPLLYLFLQIKDPFLKSLL